MAGDHDPQLGLAWLERAHTSMAAVRAVEERVALAYRDKELPGLLHLAIGGEAVAVGVIGELSEDDRIYSSHRPHGHFLAAGTPPEELFAELAGREAGMCRGRGGSMHLMHDRAVMATGIVGGGLPIAVGHALTLTEGGVAVAFFGDGAAQTGVFHESLNLAALWNAPVLFVCENNGMAEFTTREEHSKVGDVTRYGPLHRIPAEGVDGTDVEAVAFAARELLAPVRAGDGPALLECAYSRMRPHYEGDLRISQTSQAGDPLGRLEQALEEHGVDRATLRRVREQAASAAQEALSSALAGPVADPSSDAELVYAAGLS